MGRSGGTAKAAAAKLAPLGASEAMRRYNERVKAETGRGSWAKYRTRKGPVPCVECGTMLASWKSDQPRCGGCSGRRTTFISASGRAAVYERDAWTCGLCEEPVARDAPYPDPWSPSLDHIVPASLGGSDDPSNLRLAHLRCNLVRGAASK